MFQMLLLPALTFSAINSSNLSCFLEQQTLFQTLLFALSTGVIPGELNRKVWGLFCQFFQLQDWEKEILKYFLSRRCGWAVRATWLSLEQERLIPISVTYLLSSTSGKQGSCQRVPASWEDKVLFPVYSLPVMAGEESLCTVSAFWKGEAVVNQAETEKIQN